MALTETEVTVIVSATPLSAAIQQNQVTVTVQQTATPTVTVEQAVIGC